LEMIIDDEVEWDNLDPVWNEELSDTWEPTIDIGSPTW